MLSAQKHLTSERRARSQLLSSQARSRQQQLVSKADQPVAFVRSKAGSSGNGPRVATRLDDVVDEARDLLSLGRTVGRGSSRSSGGYSSGSEEEPSVAPVSRPAHEVKLESLIVPRRRNADSDFEVVPRSKVVIALDDTVPDLAALSLGAAPVRHQHDEPEDEADEDDGWQMLDGDGEEVAVPKKKKKEKRSWAKVVLG